MSHSCKSKNNDKSKKRKHGDEGSNNNDADNDLPFGEKPTHLITINEKGWKALSNAVNKGNKRAKSTFKRLISSITENCGEHEDKSNENDGGHEGDMDYSNMDSLNTEDYLQKLREKWTQDTNNTLNKVMDAILYKLLPPVKTDLDNIKTELDNDEPIKQQIEQHKSRIASWEKFLAKDPTYTDYNTMIEKEKTELTNVTKTYTERVKKIKDDTDGKFKEHFKIVFGRDMKEFGEDVQEKLDLVLQDIKLVTLD